jgi:hypothetical protein
MIMMAALPPEEQMGRYLLRAATTIMAVIGIALGAGGARLGAQAPTPRIQSAITGDVLGSSHFSPVVADLDKSIEFYGGLLGLNVPPPREPGRVRGTPSKAFETCRAGQILRFATWSPLFLASAGVWSSSSFRMPLAQPPTLASMIRAPRC